MQNADAGPDDDDGEAHDHDLDCDADFAPCTRESADAAGFKVESMTKIEAGVLGAALAIADLSGEQAEGSVAGAVDGGSAIPEFSFSGRSG